MRVLAEPRDPREEDWPLLVECAGCGRPLEIELADLSYESWKVSGYFFDGSNVSKMLYTFQCPVCGIEANGNEVAPESIPRMSLEGYLS